MPRPTDRDRVEDRRLDDDVARRVAHLARLAADDPGDRQDPGRVGDDEGLGVELAVDVIERDEPFALLREADDDPSLVDRRGIERVGGLAELEHDGVARVDDVAHRAHAGRQEPHLDAVRRRTDGDAPNGARDEPRAERRLADLHGQRVGDRPAALGYGGLRPADRGAGDGRDLPRQADEAEGVSPVRLDVDVEDGVAEEVAECSPDRGIGLEDEDALGIGRQAQLVAGAEHAVAQRAHLLCALDPSAAGQDRAGQGDGHPLARCDVRRPTDDRQWLTIADAHGRERQAVRTRMGLDGQELADDDVLPVGAPTLDALDLHAQPREPVGKLLGRELDVDIVREPAQRDAHQNCSRKRRSSSR